MHTCANLKHHEMRIKWFNTRVYFFLSWTIINFEKKHEVWFAFHLWIGGRNEVPESNGLRPSPTHQRVQLPRRDTQARMPAGRERYRDSSSAVCQCVSSTVCYLNQYGLKVINVVVGWLIYSCPAVRQDHAISAKTVEKCPRRSDPGAKTMYWRQNSGEKAKHGVTEAPRPCCPRRYEGLDAKTTLLAQDHASVFIHIFIRIGKYVHTKFHTHSNTHTNGENCPYNSSTRQI